MPMLRRGLLIPFALLALWVSGCGDSGGADTTIKGIVGATGASGSEAGKTPDADIADADAGDVEVITAWVTALDDNDLEKAASYFALPSVAENGVEVKIDTPADARLFNQTLPCGAVLSRAVSNGEFTTATFELTERPGGNCGPGTGGEAKTTFVIKDGKIKEWRRVGSGGGQAPARSV